MNCNFWPIQPTFISDCQIKSDSDGGYWQEQEHRQLRFPNIHGMLKADELRGFLADASDDKHINNPLSLFQVVPKAFNGEDASMRMKEIFPQDDFIIGLLNERRIFRIDPGKLYSNFHCCDLFRQCNKKKNELLCFESDCRIALLYHPRLEHIDIDADFESFYKGLQTTIEEYNNHKGFGTGEFSLKAKKYRLPRDSKERFYITYKCQYSKLEEFFFPIIFAGKVVAVLMQGQRFPKGMTKSDLFKDYIESSPQGRKLKQCIDDLGSNYFQGTPMSKERLNAITNRICRLEEKIRDEIHTAAQTYINERFLNWQKEFRNKIKGIDITTDNALERYSSELSKVLKEVIEEFHNGGFIRLFTIQQPDADDSTHEKCIFELIGDSSCAQSPPYKTLYFSSFPIKQEVIEKEELLGYIKKLPVGFNKEEDIFRMEVPLLSQKAYIIWKHYNHVYSGEQKRLDEYYCRTLKSLYPTLLEPYFILEGAKLEKKLEASMRISVHESAQVIPSVIDAINSSESRRILEEGGEYNGSPMITKPMHTILDVSYRLLLLEGLYRRSTLIFKKDPPKYQWCDFHRIVYSTKSLFDNTAYRKRRQSLIIVSEQSFSKYRLFTDYGFLSHVLFNLLDNAVKYGRKGSNIYMKVVVEFNKISWEVLKKEEVDCIKISIVSFGDEITDRESIYKLYFRKAHNDIEGMGIGLSLVKKLCNSLNYRIECKRSVKIADINLPMHYCYREVNNLDKVSLSDKAKRILKKEYSQDLVKTVVNQESKKDWEVTETEIEELLEKPLYRNEFEITIPISNNNLTVR